MKYCNKCGLGKSEWVACDSADCGELVESELRFTEEWCLRMAHLEGDNEIAAGRSPCQQVTTYGIVDPDYARVFSKTRCIAWMYGYAVLFNGSFTRDLDLLIVPWTDSVSPTVTPAHLIRLICDRCDLQESGHPPTQKPHGRVAYTLLFTQAKDPRFIDVSFMPQQPVKTMAEDERKLNDLLARFGDQEEIIYSAELYLLRKIAETSSDMVKARNWPEFREARGGQEKLDAAHATALHDYECWLSDGEG